MQQPSSPSKMLKNANAEVQLKDLDSAMSSKQNTLTKEESSDESTIISSQTSTLTRNVCPEMVFAVAVEGEIEVKIHKCFEQFNEELINACFS
jgi:ferredoxin-like protein FixX